MLQLKNFKYLSILSSFHRCSPEIIRMIVFLTFSVYIVQGLNVIFVIEIKYGHSVHVLWKVPQQWNGTKKEISHTGPFFLKHYFYFIHTQKTNKPKKKKK
jgi:hypothetical protein